MSFQELIKEELLPQVTKPGQYLGSEWNAYCKDWDSAKSRIAIIYPDLYELGMSNYGIKILYKIVNEHPDYLCDRAYAPMLDMDKLLREKNIPLWGWESHRPLKDFDMLGFSLGYELCYTNVLNILELSQIPIRSKDRDDSYPLIFAGGPSVHNPEPMADFFDFYLIGDGEDLILEIQDSYLKSRLEKRNREEALVKLAQIQGVYVPRFYEATSKSDYFPKTINDKVPKRIKKRIAQLNDLNQVTKSFLPNIEAVQDKQIFEIRRGCDRGCRFCQVGYAYLPVRERSPEDLLRLSKDALSNTGYDNYTLLSLSASDYTCLSEAAKALNKTHSANGVSASMPSQRADRFDLALAEELSEVRKSGMTFAPEAGSERLRRIINKGLSEEEILNAIKGSYEAGWTKIKLYFMIGLPFEEDSDLDAILDILSWSVKTARELKRANPSKYRRPINITCTISTFVPKTFTAFQWFPQCSQSEFKRKQRYLNQGLKERALEKFVKLNHTDSEIALLEAVLSRGDRRWGQVIEELWKNGSKMDAWSEYMDIEKWRTAASKFNLDLELEASKERLSGHCENPPISPWEILDLGFTERFFWDEWKKSTGEAETSPCTESKCHACGVCFNLDTKNIVNLDRSDHNPFICEIDKELRKSSFTNLQEIIRSPFSKTLPTEAMMYLRFVLSKKNDLSFIGHLDFQRIIERAFRRSGLPFVYTRGYNQRIKLRFGPPLPLFIESDWEYLEVELAEFYEDLEKLKDLLNNNLPEQARIKLVELVSPGNESSISRVLETVYSASSKDHRIDESILKSFLSQEFIEIEKLTKGKTKVKNIRAEVIDIVFDDFNKLQLRLRSSQRPDEVLKVLSPGSKSWKITKLSQILA
jgi:radical SAM family uncharacterized protein/radical SAM-linked protein